MINKSTTTPTEPKRVKIMNWMGRTLLPRMPKMDILSDFE